MGSILPAAMGLLLFPLGLALGSFLNVIIWRLPRGESLVSPGSRCPACLAPIHWRDNIPLASFLALRGRCRDCSSPIAWRYPAVEFMSGCLLWALWARWGGAQGVWIGWFAAAYVAGALLLAIAFTDCESRRIPDELLVALAAAGLASSPLNPHFHASPRDRVLWSLAGAGLGLAGGWLLYRAARAYYRREAFGEGDVYLLAGVGAWSGMRGAYDCLLLGSLFGTVFFLPLWLRGKVGGRTKIPFGPFLSAGAVVNLFWILPWTW